MELTALIENQSEDKKLHSQHSLALLLRVEDKTYFMDDSTLTIKKDRHYLADRFEHELFVTVESENEVVIISSCSHNGINCLCDTSSRNR